MAVRSWSHQATDRGGSWPPKVKFGILWCLAGDAVARAQTMAGLLSASLRNSRPNFVFFNVDDTGFGDWSWNFPGSATHGAATHSAAEDERDDDDTPRTAALRARGLRLTDFHAGSSVCTPSRAALMTGRHGLRTGVNANFNPYSLGGLPLTEATLAELLRGVGYRTAMAGKWHLGHVPPHGPMHRGFDTWLGTPIGVGGRVHLARRAYRGWG